MRIMCVAGARPNFMKIAPIMNALKQEPGIEVMLVHTGQHYDEKMSQLFFDELNIDKPDINLNVGSGSHAVQTAMIMTRFEPVLLEWKPDYVLVVGDVNSTIACGLVAVKLGVKLIHVEAGLRSFDRTMPEEINRILTDSISDLLFVSEQSGIDNLHNEGIHPSKIHFVGNVMIDTLLANREKAIKSDILGRLGIERKKFSVVTLHRPANVDNKESMMEIFRAFEVLDNETTFVFPIHPRTRNNLENMNILRYFNKLRNVIFIDPLGYLDFLCLLIHANMIITDSGGIQEETTILNVPCMTLRENTERPVTITYGTNRLVHLNASDIIDNFHDIVQNGFTDHSRMPELWDGNAATRIAHIIADQ